MLHFKASQTNYFVLHKTDTQTSCEFFNKRNLDGKWKLLTEYDEEKLRPVETAAVSGGVFACVSAWPAA